MTCVRQSSRRRLGVASSAAVALSMLSVLASSAGLLGGGCAKGGELNGDAGGAGKGGSGGATSSVTAGSHAASSGGGSGGSQGGAGGSDGGKGAEACPAGEFLTGLDGAGHAVCATIDEAADAAVNGGCSAYFGWSDNCSGCADPPTKWGFAKATACMNGAGANDTCTMPDLGGQMVNLFGLNTDGNVDDSDKLYASLHCEKGDSQSKTGPCGAGEFVTAVSNGSVTCTPASGATLDYVRESCSLYLGWRDNCDGCATAPAKWGYASTLGCANGAGAGNTCTSVVLGTETVQLFGLDTDGNVNDDDKIYVGLRCVEPTAAGGAVMGACPAGQLATGVEDDGSVVCASPAPQVAKWFRDHCSLYFGWRDSCDGCTSAPTKWGRVRDGFCMNGVGANSTCSNAVLGPESLLMYGLNPDGDVDDDDKLYVAFRCF